MADLLSIAPLVETVPIRGATVHVKGVSARGMVSLLTSFPELMKEMSKGTFSVNTILSASDELIDAVICAGCDQIDQKNAANLSLDEKVELLGAIVKVTMPRGPIPFVEALTKLMGSVSGPDAALPKASAMKSRKPSSN